MKVTKSPFHVFGGANQQRDTTSKEGSFKFNLALAKGEPWAVEYVMCGGLDKQELDDNA